MADEDFTITDNINVEQMKYALEHIAHLACSIQGVCDAILETGDKNGDLIVAVENLAAKIGWAADRCGGNKVKTGDDWLMPPAWNQKADKAKLEQEVTE